MQIVSVFKDYLIYDDLTEFLKRPYTFAEAVIRLSNIFEFYCQYSAVFPNYYALPAKRFMYKNIERKQRILERQSMASSSSEEDSSLPSQHTPPTKLFTTQFIKDLKPPDKYEHMGLEGLIDSFNKVSDSKLQLSSFLNESNLSIFSKSARHNTP